MREGETGLGVSVLQSCYLLRGERLRAGLQGRIGVVRNEEFGFGSTLFEILDGHSDKDFGWEDGYEFRVGERNGSVSM